MASSEPNAGASPVRLHLYDVTRGLAAQLSPVLLGRQVDGLWHSNLVVGDTEFSYGPPLRRFPAGQGLMGAPTRVIDLGSTLLPLALVGDMVRQLGSERFAPQSYDLLYNNCNHFANELALLVTGEPIPTELLQQTQTLLDSPLGEYLTGMWGAASPAATATPFAAGGGPTTSGAKPDAAAAGDNPVPPAGGAKPAAAATAPGAPGSRAGPSAGGPYMYGNEDFGSLLRDVLRGFISGPQGMDASAGARSIASLLHEAVQRFATAPEASDDRNAAAAAASPGACAGFGSTADAGPSTSSACPRADAGAANPCGGGWGRWGSAGAARRGCFGGRRPWRGVMAGRCGGSDTAAAAAAGGTAPPLYGSGCPWRGGAAGWRPSCCPGMAGRPWPHLPPWAMAAMGAPCAAPPPGSGCSCSCSCAPSASAAPTVVVVLLPSDLFAPGVYGGAAAPSGCCPSWACGSGGGAGGPAGACPAGAQGGGAAAAAPPPPASAAKGAGAGAGAPAASAEPPEGTVGPTGSVPAGGQGQDNKA